MRITVCIGSSCHLKGSRQVIEELQKLINTNALRGKVELAGQFCMNDCQHGVCVTVDGTKYSVQPDNVDSFFEQYVLHAV